MGDCEYSLSMGRERQVKRRESETMVLPTDLYSNNRSASVNLRAFGQGDDFIDVRFPGRFNIAGIGPQCRSGE